MAELDAFERRVADALASYAEDISPAVDAGAVAHRVALEHPRARAGALRWRMAVPLRAWVLLLLAALLAALVGGMLLVGSRHEWRLPAVVPPVGPMFACPAGTNPDEPGPVDQARPASASLERIAFDRRAGRLVAVTSTADGFFPETWTFDVCTNTWAEMHPARELPDFVDQLVYDVDSDATIGVVSGRVWSYDLRANTWTGKGVAPPGAADLGAYDPVSGLVVDVVGRWTYDVETDTWTQIRQGNGPPCEYGESAYDASVDRVVTYRGTGWDGSERRVCLIDIRRGTWSGTPAATPPDLNTGFYALVPSAVYDEATERTVFSDGRRLAAYDATTDRWEILVEAAPGGVPLLIAYDPLHRRLVGVGRDQGDDVAFDPVTHEWTVLLEATPG